MKVKIENKSVPRKIGREDRDCKAFILALKELELDQSFLWELASNDRVAISVVSTVLGRQFRTRKEGDQHRVGRVL